MLRSVGSQEVPLLGAPQDLAVGPAHLAAEPRVHLLDQLQHCWGAAWVAELI
jgi:hypothetical protein